MSFPYFYKNIRIAGPITNTEGLCSYLTNTAVSSNFNNIGLVIGNQTPFNNIIESPTTLNYSITNTDISSYTIAGYISGTGGESSITLPSWCTKIRAVLVGGGGGGGASTLKIQIDQIQHVHNEGYNQGSFTLYKFHHNQDVVVQTHQALVGGGSGGGGGFIYIPTCTVTGIQQLQAYAGSGGVATGSGQNTTLTMVLSNVTNVLVAGTGAGGGTTTAGGGGATQIPSQLVGQLNGFSGGNGENGNQVDTAVGGGSGAVQSPYTPNQNVYGYGGNGGFGTAQNVSYTGDGGSQGYYRIYYLTD